MMRRILTLMAICFPACGSIYGAGDPHVVIILVDDMGYSDAGCYNRYSKIPTPHIDSLAQDGMRFTDAHSPGALCHPSRYGLMTGQHPFRIDYTPWRTQPLIKKGQTTVPSLLKSAGYRTHMVGKWHLGFLEDGYDKPLPGGPIDVGFDSYFGIRASTDIPPYFYIRGNHAVLPPSNHIDDNASEGWSIIQGAFWRAGGIAPDLKLHDVLPRFTDEAVSVIQKHAATGTDQPMMLYLAYPAPHTPWLPDPKYQGASKAGMYGDFLVMVDAMIGRVLEALNDADMHDDTLLIFTSDNGPVWFDVDNQRFGHRSTAGLRGMKADAWEGGHRMPFIVRWPGHVATHSTSDQSICFTDIMATLAAVTNTPLPPGAGPDSFNLLPVLTGNQPQHKPIRGPIVIPAEGGTMSIRSGPWKLITHLGSGGFSKEWSPIPDRIEPTPGGPTGQLYHLGEDLAETNNLFLDRPKIVQRLQSELTHIRKQTQTRP